MRTATFVVVIAIHVVFLFLFAAHRSPSRPIGEAEAPTTLTFLPEPELTRVPDPGRLPKPPGTVRAARPSAPRAPAAVKPAPEPESSSITPTSAPDWRAEAKIAANDAITAEERKRQNPSPLAPHDFSGVRPGSTDYTKPQFGWNHARTHRVEELSGGGLLININDRCAVVLLFIFPFPACKIGKMPARSDLFDHMKDAPAIAQPKVP